MLLKLPSKRRYLFLVFSFVSFFAFISNNIIFYLTLPPFLKKMIPYGRKKKMEEEDKKAETNLEIWRKHDEKEGKGLKKIFIFIFLVFVLLYIVKSI